MVKVSDLWRWEAQPLRDKLPLLSTYQTNKQTNRFNITAVSSKPVLGKMVETVGETLLLHEIHITGQRINLILAVE